MTVGLAKLVGQIGGAVTRTAENTWDNRKKISRGIGNTLGHFLGSGRVLLSDSYDMKREFLQVHDASLL